MKNTASQKNVMIKWGVGSMKKVADLSWAELFPHLRDVCLDFAYFTGAPGRRRGEDAFLDKIAPIIQRVPVKVAIFAEAWISTLDRERLLVLAEGDDTEIAALLEDVEHGAVIYNLLNEVFENG